MCSDCLRRLLQAIGLIRKSSTSFSDREDREDMAFLFRKKQTKKQTRDGHQKMEHQLHVAKHSPDSVVDLSDCDMTEIPDGIYALCKVLLKQALLLHSNRMHTLKEMGSYSEFIKLKHCLRVLDIHQNHLNELPREIGELTNLQVLNLEQNDLKDIPEEIGRLRYLQTLNLKGNPLKALPNSVGDLVSLRLLDIEHSRIRQLPKSMAHLQSLETLILDAQHMEFPPSDVCCQGTEAIMRYLCECVGIEYHPPSAQVLSHLNIPGTPTDSVDHPKRAMSEDPLSHLAVAAMKYEKIKEEKQKQTARLERAVLEAREEAATLVLDCERNRDMLVCQIAKDQRDLDARIMSIQVQKDVEKQELLSVILQMENHAQGLIKNILEMNRQMHWTEIQLEEEEGKRVMEEQWFKVKYEEYERLKKAEVEKAMQAIMAQNYSLNELRDLYEKNKSGVINRANEESMLHDENVENVLRVKDAMAREFMERLRENEDFQKEAMLALMEQRDAKSNRLNQQIALIQGELAQLSQLEVHNKGVRAAVNQEILSQERMELAKLLCQLMDEKDRRTFELQKRLIEMEKEREDSQINFWLVQYQKLLERKPNALADQERMLDVDIVKMLNKANAQDYIPAFARHQITPDVLHRLTEQDLQRIGIYQQGLRAAVLEQIEVYLNRRKLSPEPPSPMKKASAPARQLSSEPGGPSTTILARFEVECVVCMETQATIIFVPCGHVCCCGGCSETLSECPLCRSSVGHKIDVGSGGTQSSTLFDVQNGTTTK